MFIVVVAISSSAPWNYFLLKKNNLAYLMYTSLLYSILPWIHFLQLILTFVTKVHVKHQQKHTWKYNEYTVLHYLVLMIISCRFWSHIIPGLLQTARRQSTHHHGNSSVDPSVLYFDLSPFQTHWPWPPVVHLHGNETLWRGFLDTPGHHTVQCCVQGRW